MCFPPGFLWGTATSAHQVEGGNEQNQWWAWEQQPGRIWKGDRSGLACDWWRRAEDDLALAAEMGQNSHRFSIEWSRIEPQKGCFDDRPLERYRRLITRMHELGLEPMVTLHHFTNPQWLEDQGGWLNPEAVERFARFVERAVTALGDGVRLWCTINEPAVYALLGFIEGDFPPGLHSPLQALRVLRHLLLAHAEAYRVVHRLQPDAQVGTVNHIHLFDPARASSPLDRWVASALDGIFNAGPLRAAVDGRLRFPLTWSNRRVAALVNSCDFIGINYYTREMVAFDLRRPADLFGRRFYAPGAEHADISRRDDFGDIYPEGLYRCLRAYAGLGKPLYVTENGWPDAADVHRPRALLSHITQLWRAMAEGAPVRGYYHWSLIDNFEWAEGWSQRFGLIAMDPVTQARRLRRSAELYAAIAHGNGITKELVEQYAPEAMARIFEY